MLSLAEKGESATKKKKMETIDLIGKHSPFPKAGALVVQAMASEKH